jgi:hypothetical protein
MVSVVNRLPLFNALCEKTTSVCYISFLILTFTVIYLIQSKIIVSEHIDQSSLSFFVSVCNATGWSASLKLHSQEPGALLKLHFQGSRIL